MQQVKISFDENQIKFLNKYKELGFNDKSSLVRSAIEIYRKLVEKQKLIQSSELYNEIYLEDSELKELTNQATQEWPK